MPFGFHLAKRIGQNVRRLGAAYSVLAIQDEGGDARDANGLGMHHGGLGLGKVRIGGKKTDDHFAVHSAFGGDVGEDVWVGEVASVHEISPEQRFKDLVLAPIHSGPAQDAMGIKGVGRFLDPVEGERDLLSISRFLNALVDGGGLFGSAKLLPKILLPILAFRGERRIELEGMPLHVRAHLLGYGERLLQPALADVAPRTHDVGHDVDLEGLDETVVDTLAHAHGFTHQVSNSTPDRLCVSGRPRRLA